MVVDMGCFTQDGKDTCKYYHAAVVQHKTTQKWYTYFEWGRTGAKNPQFQFVECRDKDEAQRELAKQCHEKNDRRGEWVSVGGVQTLQARNGKDCYLVRPQAKRSTGLPDARTITAVTLRPKTGATKKNVDDQTVRLMRDLNIGVVNFTRGSMADSALPTQGAIDDARVFLGEAKKRLLHVGNDIRNQVADSDLKKLTNHLYSRIPKAKPLGAAAETWILSSGNILGWEQDLDAFESALSAESTDDTSDPFQGMDVRVEYLPPTNPVGEYIRKVVPGFTNGRNGYGKMKVLNVWKVEHPKTEDDFVATVSSVGKCGDSCKGWMLQPERHDLPDDRRKLYNGSNTFCLIHGSRSVNIGGILKTRLRLPKTLVGVTLTAAMFGDGIYFADDWQKSAHYTSLTNGRYTHGAGAVSGRKAFLFLADVLLGKTHVAPGAEGFTEPPKGHHSVTGKAKYTQGWGGPLVNNEFVIYGTKQYQLRYLVEFDA